MPTISDELAQCQRSASRDVELLLAQRLAWREVSDRDELEAGLVARAAARLARGSLTRTLERRADPIGLEDATVLALGGRFAPAGEQWSHRVDRRLLEAEREVDGRRLLGEALEHSPVEQTIDVHRTRVANDDLVPEAVERGTRHHDDFCDRRVGVALVLRLARGDRDVETAHEPPPVMQSVVQPSLLAVIALLSPQVERAEWLPVEVAQPRELGDGPTPVRAPASAWLVRRFGLMRVRTRVRRIRRSGSRGRRRGSHGHGVPSVGCRGLTMVETVCRPTSASPRARPDATTP